jgi:hypothetical protein
MFVLLRRPQVRLGDSLHLVRTNATRLRHTRPNLLSNLPGRNIDARHYGKERIFDKLYLEFIVLPMGILKFHIPSLYSRHTELYAPHSLLSPSDH